MKNILNNKKVIGHLLATFTIFIWGTTFIATKLLLVDFTPLEILFFRFLLGYLALLVVKPKFIKPVSWKQEGVFFLASISGISLYQYLENLSIDYSTASNVSIIMACAAFFTAIISKIILKDEEINKLFYIGFVVSIVGVALVSFNGNIETGIFPIGDLIALVASVLWGFYSVFVKMTSKYNYSPLLVTRRIMFYGTIVLVPFLFIGNTNLSLARFADMENLFLMLFLGVLASAVCFFTWNLAVEYIGAVKTGLYVYFNPVVTIIFGIIILDEKLTVMSVIGTLLIFAGLYLSSIKEKQKVEVN